jgi:hypothetical protein
MGAEALSHDERDVAEWQVRLPVRRDPTTGSMEYGVVRITPTEAVWVSGALSGKSPWNEDPDDISNPLGEVPAVVFRRSSPAAGEFWAQAPEDFLDAQRAINHDVTDQGTIARMQGFAQPVTKGLGKEEASKLQVGYEAIINLADPDSSFTFESPQPDLEGYRMQLRDYIRTVTAANGLNPGTVDKSTAVTALGKQYEMADRTIEQARHKVEFARVETRLYRLIRAWVNYYRAASEPGDTAEVRIANGPLPKGRVDVEYREPWIAVDPLHDAQAMELRMSLGVSSRAVEVGRLNGWTLKEAEDWCDANPAESQQATPESAGTLGDAAGQTLNGAQITAVLEVAARVAAGALQPPAAVSLLVESLGISQATAQRVIDGSAPIPGMVADAPA